MSPPSPGVIPGRYLADLMDQPEALRRTAAALTAPAGLLPLLRDLRAGRFPRVVLTGMGSSHHALHAVAGRLHGPRVTSVVVETSELLYHPGALLAKDTLLVVVSQSGRSVETSRLIEAAAGRVSLIAVTNDAGSPLASRADAALVVQAGPEASVSCKTYLCTLLALEWLTALLRGEDEVAAARVLARAPELVAAYLSDWHGHVDALVALLDGVRHMFVVGRGPSLAAAGTAGLIIKEAARFPAEGMSSAAFRHGPFELLGPEVFVLVLEGAGPGAALNRRLCQDVQAAGGRAVLVGPEAPESAFRLPAVDGILRPMLEILPAQMISLALAARQGREAGLFQRASKVTIVE